MSAARVNTAMTAAVAALEAGDHATALLKATAAQGYLAGMPDSRWGDNHEMRWNHEGIQAFIVNVKGQQSAAVTAAAGGMRRMKVRYVRTTE